jgi:hypothetical protein
MTQFYRYQYDSTGVFFQTIHDDVTHAVSVNHMVLYHSSAEEAEACAEFYRLRGETPHIDTVTLLGAA